MSYRDYPRAQNRPPPLVDLIPHQRDDLDVSDEEDDFYSKEDDYLNNPKWRSGISRAADGIPRRVQRCVVIGFALVLLLFLSWRTYFGPQYAARAAQAQELRIMEETPVMGYGSNVLPQFKGMIQVSDMDEQHLPKKGKRLVFVGDVHGCREELEHLLKKVDFDHKHDHLVLTGDMIAKGPDSPGVISLVQKLGASCVRGNWEDKLLLSIAQSSSIPNTDSPDALDAASHTPGNPKLQHLAKKFSHSQLAFLQQCPVILRIGSVPHLGALVVVHAGLVPDIALEKQDPFHVMNMRTIDPKTHIPSSKHTGTPWEKFWNHRQAKVHGHGHEHTSIVYGHNRKRGLNLQEYTYGLDSGCVSGGHLTALVVDGHGKTEVVQVKCKRAEGYDTD
ncbi:Metallo-dependent phosphatase [Dothidotthia symphoricarpi CBS 119687]|uniref:Metallo-dependent phosphatase n=1 Tax=Dothidotthia symphoricarpi CBS 119687 TaxID=1392245 RepID=A0A6A6A595_9PLEO|nr:Metallo-dependent phosphatase [Dothidotthia symphoricarpi CBS 119687]KAF2126294.1 Metallo-dependent phosphatase [Dothidotthia symphoricarpi CBS 119687]